MLWLDPVVRAASAHPGNSPSQAPDPGDHLDDYSKGAYLSPMTTETIAVQLQWREFQPVTGAALEKDWVFGSDYPMDKEIVYRFSFQRADKLAVYIGHRKTTLQKRLREHLSVDDVSFLPQDAMRKHLFSGGQLRVETLSRDVIVSIGGVPAGLDWKHRFHRRLLEDAAIFIAMRDSGIILLNRPENQPRGSRNVSPISHSDVI